MSERERVEALVAEFVERREEGEELTPEAFAARHPDVEGLEEGLRDALQALELFPPGVTSVDRPERIGPWRVVGELGRGGGGRVFRVTRAGREGEAALKLLNLTAVGNPRALERFRREGKLLESLEHPGIVRVHEVSAGEELPYIVMDLVPGEALSARLADARRELRTSREGGTPPTDVLRLPGEGDTIARAARVVARLARAVHFAHERGLLHRDLKPSNVLLDEDGEPVLVDFGLAVSEESATLTESGDLLGTPHYMAPEQARGERADARTDVYGLGAVLYELLTLRPPHEGRDPLEVLQHIRTRPHVPVRRRNPAVPGRLARVVDRALTWRRARRTPDAATLARDLEAAASGEAVTARRRGPLERAEDLARFRPRTVVLVLVALLLVSVIAWTEWGRSGKEADLAPRLHTAAERAWFEDDEEALARAVERLRELGSRDARVSLYAARARDAVAEPVGDPAVDALLEGLHARQAGRWQEAVDAFDRALVAAPEWVLPIGLSGLVEPDGLEDDEAERDLARRTADLQVATRALPRSLHLARALARCLRRQERPGEAARVLERALEVAGEGTWREHSELAVCRVRAGDAAGAFEAIEEAARLVDGEHLGTVLNRMAAILDARGDSGEAERLFRELIARHPGDATLHFNLARTLDGECRLAEAREEYAAAHELDPQMLQPLVSLTHVHAGSGYTAKGCERCAAQLDEHPELFDPDEALRWLERSLDLDDCRSLWLPGYAVEVAERIDRPREVRSLLAKRLDEDGEIDERVVHLERALRELDRMIEEGGY